MIFSSFSFIFVHFVFPLPPNIADHGKLKCYRERLKAMKIRFQGDYDILLIWEASDAEEWINRLEFIPL
jgi:hypothetical protein